MKEEIKITGFDGESCQEEKIQRYQIIVKDLFKKKDIYNEKTSAIIGACRKEGGADSMVFINAGTLDTITTIAAAEKAISHVKKHMILKEFPNALISLLEEKEKNEDRD